MSSLQDLIDTAIAQDQKRQAAAKAAEQMREEQDRLRLESFAAAAWRQIEAEIGHVADEMRPYATCRYVNDSHKAQARNGQDFWIKYEIDPAGLIGFDRVTFKAWIDQTEAGEPGEIKFSEFTGADTGANDLIGALKAARQSYQHRIARLNAAARREEEEAEEAAKRGEAKRQAIQRSADLRQEWEILTAEPALDAYREWLIALRAAWLELKQQIADIQAQFDDPFYAAWMAYPVCPPDADARTEQALILMDLGALIAAIRNAPAAEWQPQPGALLDVIRFGNVTKRAYYALTWCEQPAPYTPSQAPQIAACEYRSWYYEGGAYWSYTLYAAPGRRDELNHAIAHMTANLPPAPSRPADPELPETGDPKFSEWTRIDQIEATYAYKRNQAQIYHEIFSADEREEFCDTPFI